MEPINEALALLQRQTEIETRLRQPGGTRVTEERELYALHVLCEPVVDDHARGWVCRERRLRR